MRGFVANISAGMARALVPITLVVPSARPAMLVRICCCTLLLNLVVVATALFAKQLCDLITFGDNTPAVAFIAAALILFCCVDVLARRARSWALTQIVDAVEEQSSIALAGRGRNTPAAWHSPTAFLGSDIDKIRVFANSPVMSALIDLPFAPVLAICIVIFNPWLALIACASLVVATLLLLRAPKAATPRANDSTTDLTGLANALARHSDCARTMNLTSMLTARWQLLRRAVESDRRTTAPPAWPGISGFSLFPPGEIAIVIAGAWLVRNGVVTTGAVLASYILLHLAVAPLGRILSGWPDIVAAGTAFSHIRAIPAHGQQTVTLPPPSGELVLDNVDWTPQGAQRPALRGVTLKIEAGAFLAIIGPSAAGKSTLARMLCGALAPANGSVKLDGIDLNLWNDAQLGDAIGYLPQDVALFPGTISENIARFGNASRMQIVTAATRAGVHDMILQLPAGYATIVDEELGTLSVGQKQRVGLARALLGDPPVLVLDEPDASLDAEGEAALIGCMIEARRRRRTVVIITHNTGLVRVADFVATMVGGHVMKVQRTAELLGRPAILAATG